MGVSHAGTRIIRYTPNELLWHPSTCNHARQTFTGTGKGIEGAHTMLQRHGTRKVALALSSAGIALLCAYIALKILVLQLNIGDPLFIYENKLGMWDRDAAIGFVNRPRFSGICWGGIRALTDSKGFRAGSMTTTAAPTNCTTVVGLGDSVTWGTSVNAEDSFLGLLSRRFRDIGRPVQFINAGVVGYSTVQEFLFLKHRVLAMDPDLVLVNLCSNDYLPTEDPFTNARSLYIEYLNGITNNSRQTWSEQEKEKIADLCNRFRETSDLRLAIAPESPEQADFYRFILIDTPLRLMAEACRAKNIRFIVLCIPPQSAADQYQYRCMIEPIKAFLSTNRVEFLDMTSDLVPGPHEIAAATKGRSRPRKWPILHEIDLVNRARFLAKAQDTNLFIDNMHPSRKGNSIIAERVFQSMTSTVSASK